MAPPRKTTARKRKSITLAEELGDDWSESESESESEPSSAKGSEVESDDQNKRAAVKKGVTIKKNSKIAKFSGKKQQTEMSKKTKRSVDEFKGEETEDKRSETSSSKNRAVAKKETQTPIDYANLFCVSVSVYDTHHDQHFNEVSIFVSLMEALTYKQSVCKEWASDDYENEFDFDSEEFFNDIEFDEEVEGGEGENHVQISVYPVDMSKRGKNGALLTVGDRGL
jgi:hypothetical protein